MSIASALIGAGGQLLGGLLGKSNAPSAGDNAWGHVGGIMQAAEQFGFNPLTLLGTVGAVGGSPSGDNYMGAAVADSAMILADAYAQRAKAKDLKAKNDLQAQNAKLSKTITNLTLRPQVGGTYAGQRKTPSVAAALGVSSPGATTAASVAAPGVVPDQIAERLQERALNMGDAITAPALAESPMMSAETGEAQFGNIAGDGIGAVNYGYALGPGTGNILRGEFDRRGWTTPGKDYWSAWGKALFDAGMGDPAASAERATKAKPKTSAWSYYGQAAW